MRVCFCGAVAAPDEIRSNSSGGSRNVERGVQQVGWHVHSAPPKALRRAAKRRSVRAKRGKIFLRVLFSDQEAVS